MTWCEYHEATKHSVESLRQMRQVLDWANMPDPFRHYEGLPVLDLPADPPLPETPVLDVLQGTSSSTRVVDGPAFLSQLLGLQFFQLELKLIELGRQLLTLAAKEHLPVLLDNQLQVFDLLCVRLQLFPQLTVLRHDQRFQRFYIEGIEVG
jgi:hypothetical protein